MANNVVVLLKVAPVSLPPFPITNNALTFKSQRHTLHLNCFQTKNRTTSFPSSSSILRNKASCSVWACLPPESSTSSSTAKPSFPSPQTKLYVSGQLLLLFSCCCYPFRFSYPNLPTIEKGFSFFFFFLLWVSSPLGAGVGDSFVCYYKWEIEMKKGFHLLLE